MMRVRRYTAAVLAVILIGFILLSAAAVVLEAAHDCDGFDCPVCEVIRTLIAVVRGFAAIAVMTAGVLIYVKRYTRSSRVRPFCGTPVTEKVRMLN